MTKSFDKNRYIVKNNLYNKFTKILMQIFIEVEGVLQVCENECLQPFIFSYVTVNFCISEQVTMFLYDKDTILDFNIIF